MKTTLFVMLMVFALVSCNQKPTPATQADASTGNKVKGKYGIKSGVIEYKSDMMGFAGTQTLYFDDFGAKEATETTMEMMGMKTQTIVINKDGFTYNFDPINKTGSKTSMTSDASNINFEDLSEQVMKDMNLKNEGNEKVDGKECIKYSMNSESLNMKGMYWVWKGIPIKMDMEMATAKMLMEAKSIQENPTIPPEKFEVPADIIFQ